MRHKSPVTVRGGMTLCAGVAFVALAAVSGITSLSILGATLVLLVLCGFALVRFARPVRGVSRRIAHPVLTAGRRTPVTLDVQHGPRLGCSAAWWDALPAGLEPSVPQFLQGRAGTREHVGYTLSAHTRGRYHVGVFVLEIVDPLGLARRVQRITDTSEALVGPSLIQLRTTGSALGVASASEGEIHLHRGAGLDNLMARPHVPGDSMRRVHWRATAHRGELMVRDEEHESVKTAVVLLNLASSAYQVDPHRRPSETFEHALVALVSIADRLLRDGYMVWVLDEHQEPLIAPMQTPGALFELVARAATLTPGVHRNEPTRVPHDVMRGPVVVVSGAVAPPRVAELAPHARVFLTEHVPQHPENQVALAAHTQVLQGPIEESLPAAWAAATATGSRR